MFVQQISIFLENRSGRLYEVTRILSEANINICALCIADTVDFGILRLIVNDPQKAEEVLRESGFTVMKNNVLAVVMDNTPGSLFKILAVLKEDGMQVEYTYAFVEQSCENKKEAMVVLCIDNVDKGLKRLQESKINVVSPDVVYNL